jgi:ParB family chromosome partitioning protein
MMPSKSSIEKNLGPVFLKLCEVVEQPEGVLVTPKRPLTNEEFQQLHQRIVVRMGGEYLLGKRQFLFPLVKLPADSVAMRERTLQLLPLDKLILPSSPIRNEPTDAEINELAETIGTHGVLEPLVARPFKDGKYEVVIGSRRLRAAERAGLEDTVCTVMELTDREALELQFIENEQRKNLTDYEKGRWLKEMLEKFPEDYPNMDVLAKRAGYTDHAQVSRLISHYEFVEKQKKTLPSDLVPRGTKLSEFVTREIQKAPKELQTKVIETVVEEGLSARETAKAIEAITMPNVSDDEAIAAIQEDTQKRIEAEEKRQKTLVEKLKKCYPADLVDYVAKRDGVTTEGSMFKASAAIVSEMWRKLLELGLIDEILKENKEGLSQ